MQQDDFLLQYTIIVNHVSPIMCLRNKHYLLCYRSKIFSTLKREDKLSGPN